MPVTRGRYFRIGLAKWSSASGSPTYNQLVQGALYLNIVKCALGALYVVLGGKRWDKNIKGAKPFGVSKCLPPLSGSALKRESSPVGPHGLILEKEHEWLANRKGSIVMAVAINVYIRRSLGISDR
jgi:hypothetical protein